MRRALRASYVIVIASAFAACSVERKEVAFEPPPDAAAPSFVRPDEERDGSATLTKGFCPSFECPEEFATCDGSYTCGIDLRSSSDHCGACGNACDTALPSSYNAQWACVAGACQIQCAVDPNTAQAAYADCNGAVEDGCETYIGGCDRDNCGGCNLKCKNDEHCAHGLCVTCPTGSARCSDNCEYWQEDYCKSLDSDDKNCGACGRNCYDVLRAQGISLKAGQTAVCHAGACEVGCYEEAGDCDGLPENGCETTLRNDRRNCGACGVECAPHESCIGQGLFGGVGRCVDLANACPPGRSLCPGVSVALSYCAVLDTDAANCGACGNVCPGLGEDGHRRVDCVMGRCVSRCDAGYGDCDGSGVCRDLRRDPYNCGACGNACEPKQPCIDGVCATKPCGEAR